MYNNFCFLWLLYKEISRSEDVKMKEKTEYSIKKLEAKLNQYPSLLHNAAMLWAENRKISAVISALSMDDTADIKRIAAFYNAHADFLSTIFAARHCSVDGYISAMNKSIRDEKYNLALYGIKEIHSMLIQNPLSAFPEFHKRMDVLEEVDLSIEF